MRRTRILVVDDKENYLSLFRRILPASMDVVTVNDGARALGILACESFDVVVTDMRMPGADGMTLLKEVKRQSPDIEVVVMTAYGNVADAVLAMKAGAYDYLTKPFDADEACGLVERAAERKSLREQAQDAGAALAGVERFHGLVGRSPAMQRLFQLMQRAADTDATVLVTGESGTGKELAARAIHGASGRAAKRFVPVNCGALPETLVEAELFGYEKGAFTDALTARRGLFEEADGGTIFLDEIGDLPLAMQVKVTRVLQERALRRVGATIETAVDVRVIAATSAELLRKIGEGGFREDLYYRLNVIRVDLPPLRERPEDVPALAALFLERVKRGGALPRGFTPEALAALVQYAWPGNVRELENGIERAVALSSGSRIGLDSLPEEITPSRRASSDLGRLVELSYRDVLALSRDRVTRDYLVALMTCVHGNVKQAADQAGLERESLHRLLRRYGIRGDDYRKPQ